MLLIHRNYGPPGSNPRRGATSVGTLLNCSGFIVTLTVIGVQRAECSSHDFASRWYRTLSYRLRSQCEVAPLLLLTIRLDTFTGSNSFNVIFVRHCRSLSFQRASGVPIRPPLIPLSARMIP